MAGWIRRALGLVSSGYAKPDPVDPLDESSASLLADQFDRLLSSADEACARRDYQHARSLLNEAIELRHDAAHAHYKLGAVLKWQGKLEDAADSFVMALCFAPEMAEAHQALALVERTQGKLDEALKSVARAIELGMRTALTYNLQGALQVSLRQFDPAIASFETAIAVDADSANAHSNLGCTLIRDRGDYDRGAFHIERAVELDPDNPTVQCNLTMALMHRGKIAESLSICDRLLTQDSSMDEARLNRALARLALGDFERGWDDYEARRLVPCNYVPRKFQCPAWTGEDVSQKTVLVHGEQGLGDEIMFASCFAEVIGRARSCVIECAPRLASLFRRSFPSATVIGGVQCGTTPAWWSSATAIDAEIAAGSLPRHFRRSAAAFPKHAGYLVPDAARVRHWREQLAALGPGPNIGISWRGGMRNTRRESRSIGLLDWAPILRACNANFVSLQYGDTREEREQLNAGIGIPLHHWQHAVDDLDETAALISALDLVISVTTTVIHLSGALGRPVWILTPANPEWRYQARGETMPWYPSARLIRQPSLGDWRPVLSDVARRLAVRPSERKD